ncbi:MAG TPA: pyridoxal-dependent decarboxylase [Gammaproteobacteria bacterium]
MTGNHDLFPLFLGPLGENSELFEKLLVEFLRDHVYWRRNFHPEDPPVIPVLAATTPHYRETAAKMAAELHQLSAALKRSVPFSSPRYMGHMTSDLLMPALLAQIMTLPYNPNNVVDEAAPVTLDMEISVGLQLARMIGFNTDESAQDCAFGHITSGGTVANYEALNVQRALRHYPLAVAAALRECRSIELETSQGENLADCDDWRLANFSNREVMELQHSLLTAAVTLPEARGRDLLARVNAERLETLGWAAFARRHPGWREPVVLVPVTAHYSWQKGVKLIGLGSAQLREIPETGMRMNTTALANTLADLHASRTPVLAIVGVLGTTEFGTLDPVHDILAVRDRWQQKGLYAPVHVDAAWGGYLATLFRDEDGAFTAHETVQQEFKYFPSTPVHETFRALARVDSVTIDPHKLGFVPFGAGAIVFRDQRMLDMVSLRADYVFDPAHDASSYRDKFRQLGRYILEGSKSGAAAAAVHVSQRVLPLHRDGLGRLIRETIRATEYFYDRVSVLAATLAPDATLIVPFEPDSNLICLAINPADNSRLDAANEFTRAVFDVMKVDATLPVQTREFFGSYTNLSRKVLGDDVFRRILEELGLADDPGQDELFILRHTLMNPWLADSVNGINYVDRYGDFLIRTVRAVAKRFRRHAGYA